MLSIFNKWKSSSKLVKWSSIIILLIIISLTIFLPIYFLVIKKSSDTIPICNTSLIELYFPKGRSHYLFEPEHKGLLIPFHNMDINVYNDLKTNIYNVIPNKVCAKAMLRVGESMNENKVKFAIIEKMNIDRNSKGLYITFENVDNINTIEDIFPMIIKLETKCKDSDGNLLDTYPEKCSYF